MRESLYKAKKNTEWECTTQYSMFLEKMQEEQRIFFKIAE